MIFNQNRYRIRAYSLLFILGLSIVGFVGCMKSSHQEIPTAQESWHKALDLFNRERYQRAQTVLKDIILNFSGSTIIDSAQFYLARTQYELRDYVDAADEFHKLISLYPSSGLAGAASFYEALSNYQLSPIYSLDQEFTIKSFDAFQRFLEDYPNHSYADSAYKYIALCREKLAHKEYAAADLYFNLDEYASAVLYADLVLSNYYDTSFADEAQFLKVRSYVSLKEWPRAKQELDTYVTKYPNGLHIGQAKSLLVSVTSNLADKK
jgi:outer membrane protein assembly factor BamD